MWLLPCLVLVGCASIPGGPGEPLLELTTVPELGSHASLHGQALHVHPTDYALYAYAWMGPERGWHSRPRSGQGRTRLRLDGTWSVDLTRTEDDAYDASEVLVFLVPEDQDLPWLEGESQLPAELTDPPPVHAGARRTVEGHDRQLLFSGRTWTVRSSDEPERPGPNLWSDSAEAAHVDVDQQLVLSITEADGDYLSAEVNLTESLGYGTYLWAMESPPRHPNHYAVTGLFVRDDEVERENREFDVEFARWGDPDGPDAQFAVAPWEHPGNGEKFSVGPLYEPTLHAVRWTPGLLEFSSSVGHGWPPAPEDVLHTWTYDGPDVPIPETELVRINLWMFRFFELPAGAGDDIELVVSDFSFEPE